MATTNPSKRLSAASTYEQIFKTRHRTPGRPRREDGEDVLFPSGNAHPAIVRIAERRAFAVVHEESRKRLTEVFLSELSVLKRRGVEQVALDSGLTLEPETD